MTLSSFILHFHGKCPLPSTHCPLPIAFHPMSLVSHTWFLTGPTASGKTAIGLALAEKIGAEIISMDSMAVYRGMDIGTAKPTVEERKRVPHHLIDRVNPQEEFSLARYLDAAMAIAEEIKSRARQVLFVGGTPLYLKGLLRGIFEGPPADEKFRLLLLTKSKSNEPGWLHNQLKAVDPTTAVRLHANDSRRIIRCWRFSRKPATPSANCSNSLTMGDRRRIVACSLSTARERNFRPGSTVAWKPCSPVDWSRRFAASWPIPVD